MKLFSEQLESQLQLENKDNTLLSVAGVMFGNWGRVLIVMHRSVSG